MNILNKIKKKLYYIVKQFNVIDGCVSLGDESYISGSILSGDIKIGMNCRIHQSHVEGVVHVGKFTNLWGPGICIFGKKEGVSIGRYCSIARNVSIQEDYHNTARITTFFLERNLLGRPLAENAVTSNGKVVIGNDVWIGSGAHIMSGVTVSDGVVVGAGAVVTKDVPPYAIVVGNPAKIIRYRFDKERIDYLMKLQWWNWSIKKIQKNSEFLLSETTSEFIID